MSLPAGLSSYWSPWVPSGPSVAESLGEGEAWIGGWDGVGLYEGNTKVPEYQNTSAHITTHRVLIVPDVGVALQAPLSAVRQTEFYAGFMRSSAKITLTLGLPDPAGPLPGPSASTLSPSVPSSAPGSASASVSTLLPPSSPAPATWSCGVCGHANPLPTSGLSPATKCALCGVAYATSRTMSPPPSRAGTPASLAAASSSAGAMTRSSLVSETDTDADSDAPPPTSQVACPACTFLNHPSLAQCEICGTPLPRKRPPQAQGRQQDTVRLSFRKGGDKEAYRRLKGVLSDKVWERVEGPVARRDGEEKTGAGIEAIMRAISLEARAKDEGMQDAFRDLEVLMVRAGEMVRLAQSLNAKLTATGGTGNDTDATLVRSSLVQLGLPAPAVTQDMVRDERAYLDGLARELGAILTGRPAGTLASPSAPAAPPDGLMLRPGQGVIGLDTVWGLWMRARGVALLPPATLVQVLPLLPQHTRPAIHKLDLPSGLSVLYAPAYAPGALLGRLMARMEGSPSRDPQAPGADPDDPEQGAVQTETGLSIIDIAAHEGLPIGLASELVEMLAIHPPQWGGLVRDDQAGPGDGGTLWYRDIIREWPLGQVG